MPDWTIILFNKKLPNSFSAMSTVTKYLTSADAYLAWLPRVAFNVNPRASKILITSLCVSGGYYLGKAYLARAGINFGLCRFVGMQY